jgi:hypothetical protein
VQQIIDFMLELDKLKAVKRKVRPFELSESGELYGRLRGTATFRSKMSGRE